MPIFVQFFMLHTIWYMARILHFLEVGCGCSGKVPREEFAELRMCFQALTKPEQDIFLTAKFRSMAGGAIITSRTRIASTRDRSTAGIVVH